MNKSILSLRK